MRLRWTPAAVEDLEQITDYLFEQTPEHAPRLVREIYGAPALLIQFPNRGRPGRKPRTRELILPSLPYIVVYEILEHAVRVLRILHSARRWPKEG